MGCPDIEVECSVGPDGDSDRHGCASVDVCCTGIELLAEIHRLDTLGTKSGTDRRTGACLASSDNELDDLVSDLGTTGHFDGWADEDSVG